MQNSEHKRPHPLDQPRSHTTTLAQSHQQATSKRRQTHNQIANTTPLDDITTHKHTETQSSNTQNARADTLAHTDTDTHTMLLALIKNNEVHN